MNIVPFKAAFPKVDLITSPKSFFANIKFQFREYRKSGFYDESNKEGLYVYQITNKYGKHLGLICCTEVADMKSGKVLKHEKTLASKEQQMMHLLLQRKALVKPVLLAYKPVVKVQNLLKAHIKNHKPRVDVTFENNTERHIVWSITEKDLINKLVKLFSKIPKSYIGDGHHRSTTVALLNASKDLGEEAKKYNQLLTAYFPFSELHIFDFNRAVDIGEIMTGSSFIAELSTYFNIEKLDKEAKPSKKHTVTMYLEKQWYLLSWKSKILTAKKDKNPILDAALINKNIFGKILGIKDVRVDQRIKYYGGVEPIKKIVKHADRCALGVGICIYPVSPKQLTGMADQHQTLPPKSTWFEPRLVSGIIAKDL